MRIAIASVPVVGSWNVRDEIIAAHPATHQLDMVGNATVNDRNPNIAGPNGIIPGRWQVDPICFKVMPLARILRIVRRQRREHDVIRLRIFNIRQSRDIFGDFLHFHQRQSGWQAQYMCAIGNSPKIFQINSARSSQYLQPGLTGRRIASFQVCVGFIFDDQLAGWKISLAILNAQIRFLVFIRPRLHRPNSQCGNNGYKQGHRDIAYRLSIIFH